MQISSLPQANRLPRRKLVYMELFRASLRGIVEKDFPLILQNSGNGGYTGAVQKILHK